MEPFELSRCRLDGVNLIEASAGTGKTYALAGLYVRLLIEKRFDARQILVITFTTSATAELQRRIRAMVSDAHRAFVNAKADPGWLADLLEKYPAQNERKAIARHLALTLANYDETAIYTIHGFCQRVLTDHAFAGSVLFEAEFLQNQTALEKEFVEDFWRRQFYDNSPGIVRYALAKKLRPERLLNLLRLVLAKPDMTILPEFRPFSRDQFERLLEGLNASYERLKALWLQDKEGVAQALSDDALSGATYGKKVVALVEALEVLMAQDEPVVPMPESLQKITTEFIRSKEKKNRTAPEHPLFDIAQEVWDQSQGLANELDTYLLDLQKRFMEEARDKFSESKRQKNVLYFDDLLIRVRDALMAEGGHRLAEGLRKQYAAVLVDEFQDTDPIQYAILQSVFLPDDVSSRRIVFYIGDPKQAIYSFRGADIYAYLRAAKSVDHTYTMNHNWRSEASLIRAINALFEKQERPFYSDEILYSRIHPGVQAPVSPLTFAGEALPALHWWFVSGAQEGQPRLLGQTREIIYAAVVSEILALLKSGRNRVALIGERPVSPHDIAILARTNFEAIEFRKRLASMGVPCVIYSRESVFATDEANELIWLMQAIAHGDDEGYLLTAQTTSFFDRRASDLAACLEDENRLERLRERFKDYLELWLRRGFMTCFHTLLEQEGVRPRIAARPDGERRLTNYLHLAERLGQAEVRENLTPPKLIGWLRDMAQAPDSAKEDEQMRLETDCLCVRIVTMHKSKGLEYPIVFCPFTWEEGQKPKDTPPVCFHEKDRNWRATADFGSENLDAHVARRDAEALAEQCRLLYVALTRAKNRCYFVWGNIKNTQRGALFYLFHRALWKSQAGDFTDEDMLSHIESFAADAPGDILVKTLREVDLPEAWQPERIGGELACRTFSGRIDPRWKMTSYTYITASVHEEEPLDEEADIPVLSEETSGNDCADTLCDLPPGAATGIALHEILEQMDFQSVRGEPSKTIVSDVLARYSYPSAWQGVIIQAMEQLVQTELHAHEGEAFRLSQVQRGRTLRELEFYYPLREMSADRFVAALSKHGRFGQERHRKLSFPPIRGFLKGVIDLVFEHQGRFYLVDWKSNHLGNRSEDYQAEKIDRAMSRSFYDVQYLIYTVALHRYLKARLPGYSYREHFGGVYYFFLRGISGQADHGCGIFFDRPGEDVIAGLERTMVAD